VALVGVWTMYAAEEWGRVQCLQGVKQQPGILTNTVFPNVAICHSIELLTVNTQTGLLGR
jgi:hypothetical protein